MVAFTDECIFLSISERSSVSELLSFCILGSVMFTEDSWTLYGKDAIIQTERISKDEEKIHVRYSDFDAVCSGRM